MVDMIYPTIPERSMKDLRYLDVLLKSISKLCGVNFIMSVFYNVKSVKLGIRYLIFKRIGEIKI